MKHSDLSDQFNQLDLLDHYEEDMSIDEAQHETTSYVSIHTSSFRDLLLKPELVQALMDCGFEHPSQVQYECIPQAM